MCRLLDSSAPGSAYSVRPYDVADLDQHPDSARMWATILQLRDSVDLQLAEASEGVAEEAKAQGEEKGWEDARRELHGLRFTIEAGDETAPIVFGHNLKNEADDDLTATVDEALDHLADDLNEMLAGSADTLAAIAKAKANGALMLAQLRSQIDAAAATKDLDWHTRHEMQQGRFDAKSLGRILKKDELATLAITAIVALSRVTKP